jgi:hypothetical protein
MRAALITLAAALALLVSAAAASGGAPVGHGAILGVIPHVGVHASPLADPPTSRGSGPVVYHSGQVMQTNTAYAIYWSPSGFSDASYENLINRYFGDVAAASSSPSNVYSVATQYYDNNGAIRYKSTFGGAYVDTNPFPVSGCGQASVCLTDAQLQTEIQTVLTHQGWHGGTSNMFFIFTPNGVASCTDSSDSVCSTNIYCAYHSDFFDSKGEDVIYANEPYSGTIPGCTHSLVGQQGFPNDHDADATINTISHEHNEAISDPFGDAWWSGDVDSDEIADLCAGDFGSTPLGTSSGQPYNQLINGHQYSLQEEYSNDNSSCVRGYTPTVVPSTVAPPVLSGLTALGKTMSTSDGSWAHAPSGYGYQWQRCAADGSGCAAISGATTATYLLTAADVGRVVRSTVSAHNAVGAAAPIASDASPVVVTVPIATGLPRLSGVAAVGKKLATTSGSWNTAASFTYQWLRCAADGTGCSSISGATSATYTAARVDAGHRLEVRVTATNNAATTPALSNHSGVVIAVPAATKTPHVSGRARAGRRLKTTRGSWSGPPKSYRYQWLRCNGHGRSCRRIAHATRSMYRLTKSDAGHRLRVRVSAVDAAGAGTASSKATARVPATRKHS